MKARIDLMRGNPKLVQSLLRASQINGCAYCLDMHSKDARAAGETEQVSATHVPDSVYELVRAHFSEEEIKTLTLAVAMINTWNRFNVALRTVPGDYKPGMFRELKRSLA